MSKELRKSPEQVKYKKTILRSTQSDIFKKISRLDKKSGNGLIK